MRNNRRSSAAVLAVVTVFGISPLAISAQSKSNQPRLAPEELHARMFLQRAEEAAFASTIMAKLALTKSSDKEILRIAQEVIDHRSKIMEDRKQLFQSRNLQPHDGMRSEDYKTYLKLKTLVGSAFDEAYITFLLALDREEVLAYHYQEMVGLEDVRQQSKEHKALLIIDWKDIEALAKERGITVAQSLKIPILPSVNHSQLVGGN